MKLINIIIGFGLFLIAFTTCENKNNDLNTNKINQKILFQHYYINFAWGYQHTGWLIDSSGCVYCYNLPEKWNHCDSLGYLSVTEMDSNILEADSICYILDKKELTNKFKLIEKAAEGLISEPIHEAYDAGTAVFAGFTCIIE